jgi:hypothetical protein
MSIQKSMSKSLSQAGLAALVLFGICWVVSCGKAQPSSSCKPNFYSTTGDLSMMVTYIPNSLNDFELEVCTNTTFLDRQFTVYGLDNILNLNLMDPNTHYRLANVTDGLHVGDRYTVTLDSSDVWFVIFADDTGCQLATTDEFIRGTIR